MSTEQSVTIDRVAPLDLDAEQFRSSGHALVDRIADFLAGLRERPVAPRISPSTVREILGQGSLPERGSDIDRLLDETASLMFDHSTFNGHPRFFGYITASAAPSGALAEMLAATVNPNIGAWSLSPIASEIERQTVRWVAELIGYPASCGGIFVSGGNVANMVGFLAARLAKATWDPRTAGIGGADGSRRMVLYTSAETHTWVQKAADLFGLGTDAIRWSDIDERRRMRTDLLRARIAEDRARGLVPFMIIGTAGSVGTGAIDPLVELNAIAREEDLWFHVDGAYGAPAAALPGADPDLKALSLADSVAVDPHKWLYNPLEAGCVLVRDADALHATFTYKPSYYHFAGDRDDPPINYNEWGPQNSRGFRALKVWLSLRHVGREGYVRMIADDIALARAMFDRAAAHPELEALTHGLSITAFRYVPSELAKKESLSTADEEYLNTLNTELLTRLNERGRVYLSNAVIGGRFALRMCVVNFRTTMADIDALPEIVVEEGRRLARER